MTEITAHCTYCDKPVSHDTEGPAWDRPSCPSVEGVEWHSKENLARCGHQGIVTATDAQGHRWLAEYDVEDGTMFAWLTVDGIQVGGHGNVFIDNEGTPRFAGVDCHETMRQVTGEREDYDNLDDYQRRYEEYEGAKKLVLAALAEVAKTSMSPVFEGTVWEEMQDGEKRREEEARRGAMDGLQINIEENLYSEYPLTPEEKAEVLRKVADSLLTNQS